MNRFLLHGLAAGLLASPAFAQSSSGTWNDLPDRFQIDAGYFRIAPETVLRYDAGQGPGGDIDFENNFGLDAQADTFWVDGTWRVGRRHQLKLTFTRISRARDAFTLQRDFVWGGQEFEVGLSASTELS